MSYLYRFQTSLDRVLFSSDSLLSPSLVNDLGGNVHGEGKSSGRPADEVVTIIKSKGGVAVPNYGL